MAHYTVNNHAQHSSFRRSCGSLVSPVTLVTRFSAILEHPNRRYYVVVPLKGLV